jgi:hypothetical protein
MLEFTLLFGALIAMGSILATVGLLADEAKSMRTVPVRRR